MEVSEFEESFFIDKSPVLEANFNPYYLPVQSGLGSRVTIADHQVISLGSNDYLGLASNELLKEKAHEALDKYGISMCGTAIVVGQTDLNRELEIKSAALVKQEDALVYPSCFQANTGLFQMLCKDDDIVLADKGAHSSLLNGVFLSKARFRLFRHNDVKHLRKLLEQSTGHRMRFIVMDGLYSTLGDYPPLDEICALAKEFDAYTILDDAHGIGVLGRKGRGVLELFDAYEDIDMVTGSYGKALGCAGGFIAGKYRITDYFRYRNPMYIYSTALTPALSAACLAAIDLSMNHPEWRERIWAYKDRLVNALEKLGYRLTPSQAPLFSVLFNSTAETFTAARILFEKGVYGTPFVHPSVPRRSPRIRLIPHAGLTGEDIDRVIEIFSETRKELNR